MSNHTAFGVHIGDLTLKPATVHIIAYDDNAVKVMGSCIIHAHSGKTVYKLECQVTKTEGYLSLGDTQL